jgi:hypothetical protein
MHRLLFGIDKRQLTPLSDSDLWRILRGLRSHARFDPFRLWLVGSRVDPGHESSDVDLILSPRLRVPPGDAVIERALWHCRNFGLHLAKPTCVIDPCYRAQGPALARDPLRPDTIMQSIKLCSPKLARLINDKSIQQYRRLGRFSIEYLRPAQNTDFYGKLPTGVFNGKNEPYLRPAVEVRISGHPV